MRRTLEIDPVLDGRTGGVALVAGYLVIVVVLYGQTGATLEAAVASPQRAMYFIVFPAIGILSGVFATLDGPYAIAAVIPTATYLGAVGLTLALFLGASIALTLAGCLGFGLAVLALVGALRSALPDLGVGALVE